MDIIDFTCDVCGLEKTHQFFMNTTGLDKQKYSLYKCTNCQMIRLLPQLSNKFLEDYYEHNYTGGVKVGIVNEGSPIFSNLAAIEDGFIKLKYIEKYSKKTGGKLLDVGCGHGFFLYAAKEKNYESLGIDVDEEAIEYSSKLNIEIKKIPISSLSQLETKTFDLVTFWQVLEHVTEPGKVITETADLLKTGGIIAGSVPNIKGIGFRMQKEKWYMIIPPEHVNYFCEESVTKLLETSGFCPIFVGTIPIYATPYFALGIRARLMRKINKMDKTIIKKILYLVHRCMTLVKRYLIYKPLNIIIMLLKIRGNSVFFVAEKINNKN